MPKPDQMAADSGSPSGCEPESLYSPLARAFHWITVAGLAVLIPVGLWMTYRAEQNLWDATTNMLYSAHKLLGFTLLFFILARLVYRLVNGVPGHAPSLSPVQRIGASVVHWAIYACLLAMAITGWLGTSAFPALTVFGAFDLPAIIGPDKAFAEQMFNLHHLLSRLLFVLIAVHIAAALLHLIVFRDGVFQRMWPRRQ